MKTIANLKVTTLALFIACLPAFSGCSGLEGTAKNQQVLLLKNIEPENQKPANPPVRPAQPYIQDPDKSLY